MEKEERIRNLTQLYYSKPEVQETILKFAKDREVVPRYFEQFGKRPDVLQYPGDILNLVKKGATSFHASEELWENPLNLNSELNKRELNEMRKGWDLLIDIDSKYLEFSKRALILIVRELENFGIKNFGIKFSGSKGFHLIIPWNSFPKKIYDFNAKEMFPEWPRAICEFLIVRIKRDYNREVGKEDLKALQKITNLKEDDLAVSVCPQCGRPSQKGKRILFKCSLCKTEIERNNPKSTKRVLKCIQDNCVGFLEEIDSKEIFYCEYCKISNVSKFAKSDGKNVVYSKFARETENYVGEFEKEFQENVLGGLDLVLVAPRHLFRMPYSLHEKTALTSAVIFKNEIENFDPRTANPLNVKIREFLPTSIEGEARKLLIEALEWKRRIENLENKFGESETAKEYGEINSAEITEEMFPPAIKKLLLGLRDGRKRGLFILITFLKALNFSNEYIAKKIYEWNKKNEVPLKEGYIKSQLAWNFRQKNKILPPNYSKNAFYADLGLLEKKPLTKNPVGDVVNNLRNKNKKTSN